MNRCARKQKRTKKTYENNTTRRLRAVQTSKGHSGPVDRDN